MFKKLICITVCIILGELFAAAAGVVKPEKQWVNLDDVDQPTRLATLREHVFVTPSHFPPLYQAAKDLQDLFAHVGINARGVFGGTLGILRFGECLPWDDDIDYAVSVTQEEKLRELIPLANKLGYNLFPDELVGWKFYRKEQLIDPDTKEPHHIFIDIFLFKLEGKIYIPIHEKARKMFPKAWFTEREFETRTVLKCGPLKMPCSTYIRDTLTRFYGKTCETEALFYFSHIKENPINYKWTIRATDEYPSYKHLVLEDRVKAMLETLVRD